MKIVFVGIHNKENKAPLDSTTKTGQIIDLICGHFNGLEFKRMNLFPVDHLPEKDLHEDYVKRFINLIDFDSYYMLLGKTVGDLLSIDLQQNSRCFFHPGYALRKGPNFKEAYIKHIVKHIENISNRG